MTDRPDPAEWIAKRRELLAAATEGPWDYYRPHPLYRIYRVSSVAPGGYLDDEAASCDDVRATENAALIADARTSLPRTLDALEAVLAPHQLHEVPGGQRWCLHCGADWPCPTVAAITEALS